MPRYNEAELVKYKEILDKTFRDTDYPVSNFDTYLTDLEGFVPLKTNGLVDGLYLINKRGFVYSIHLGRVINWSYFNSIRSIINSGKINAFPRVPLYIGLRDEVTNKRQYKYFYVDDLILETFHPEVYNQYVELINAGYNVKIKPKDGDYLNIDAGNLVLHHSTSRNKRLETRNPSEKSRLYLKKALRDLTFINIKTKERKKFLDGELASEALGITQSSLRNSYINGKLFKRIYMATWLVEKDNS